MLFKLRTPSYIGPTTCAGATRWICSSQVLPLAPGFCDGARFCVAAGAPLWEILAAGDWKSPAFLDYLDKFRLERDVVMQAHLDESDAEVED